MDKIDYNILHRSLLRAASGDSDLAWSAIGMAYLRLDTTKDIPEQVAFLRRSAMGHILDVYTKRRNTAFIAQSQLHAPVTAHADDEDNRMEDELTIKTASPDKRDECDILKDFDAVTPPEYQEALHIVIAAIFDGYFNGAMTPELVRKLLQKNKLAGNLSKVSRAIVKIIMENY